MRHNYYTLSKLALLLGLLLFISCDSTTETTPNQAKQGITGSVKSEETNAVIPGVRIYLENQATPGVLADSTSSNTLGEFKFEGVRVGTYNIYCLKEGFDTDVSEVTVDTGKTVQVAIFMKPESQPQDRAYFHIRDARTLAPIEGAIVYQASSGWLDTSDASGNASYNGSYVGTLIFMISAPGYLDAYDTMKIESSAKLDTVSLIKFEDHLVASYRFSNNFVDSSGKGHDGTRHGCTFTTDRFGTATSALQCNGTTDYVSVPDAAELDFDKFTDFTICVWANTSASQSSGKDHPLVAKSEEVASVMTGYWVGFFNEIYVGARFGTTYGGLYTMDVNPNADGRWHLWSFVFIRNWGVRIYIDGELFEERQDGEGDLLGNINTAAQLLIGGTGSSAAAFKGKLDDVKIFNVALDENAVNTVYHEYGW